LGKPVSLTFSVDPAVLASLVDLCQLGTQIDHINKVTDAVISQWLESHKEVKKDTLSASQVQSLVEKSLRINLSEKDANQRILILFADYTSLLRVHGLSWVIQDHPKKAVEHILDAIKPKHLQSRLRDDLAFSHANLKKDFIAFMKHAASRAEHSGEFEDLESATVQANYRSQSGGKDKKGSAVTSNKSTGQSSSDSTASLASGSGDGKAKEFPDCLNPACSAKHYLKNCTVTSQERKDELYAERAAARKSAGIQRETRSHAQTIPAPATTGADVRVTTAKAVSFGEQATDGRIPISFGTDAKYVALPDIGADDNVLPRALLKSLEDSGMFVPFRTLPQPLAVELAVKDPKVEVQVTQQARLTVELLFPAGPLRLRNVC
jgi:hypothetical protein